MYMYKNTDIEKLICCICIPLYALMQILSFLSMRFLRIACLKTKKRNVFYILYDSRFKKECQCINRTYKYTDKHTYMNIVTYTHA